MISSVNFIIRQIAYKAKQRCVMGVGMRLYAQLVQTKNKQCKSAIILQCYQPHSSAFIWLLFPTPVNSTLLSFPCVAKIYLVFFWKCLLTCVCWYYYFWQAIPYIYKFPLVFHCSYGRILYCFRNKAKSGGSQNQFKVIFFKILTQTASDILH